MRASSLRKKHNWLKKASQATLIRAAIMPSLDFVNNAGTISIKPMFSKPSTELQKKEPDYVSELGKITP